MQPSKVEQLSDPAGIWEGHTGQGLGGSDESAIDNSAQILYKIPVLFRAVRESVPSGSVARQPGEG